MDRKNKVWLIVLIVLLVLAVAGMVVSRNQLTDKQAEFDAVNAQLTQAQESNAALESDLTKAQEEVERLTESLAGVQSAEPTEAPEVSEQATETPTDAPTEAPAESADVQSLEAELAQTQSDLDAQRAAVTAAETALADRQAQLDAANADIAAMEAQIAEMTTETQNDADALAELKAQLEAALCERDAIAAELEAARAEYEKRAAELEAYLLSRELVDGEAHVATTAVREIGVSADGMTAACSYTNTSVSGNAVVLTIVCDGKELFRSAPIAPGESVTEAALTEALAAGEYEASMVTTVYNDDGAVQLESRVPVTLKVAE